MSIHMNSIKHDISWCMMGGWSAHIILHVLGLSCLYLIILWFHDLGWLLCHLPRHFLPWLMGSFLFLESWHFLSKQGWTHTIIIVPRGTQPCTFVGSEWDSGDSKRIKNFLLFRCLERMKLFFQADHYFLVIIN